MSVHLFDGLAEAGAYAGADVHAELALGDAVFEAIGGLAGGMGRVLGARGPDKSAESAG